MPHDVNGNILAVGDAVILRATVTQVHAGEEYCNISIESVNGRKPDGLRETCSAINAAVLEKIENPDQCVPDDVLRAEETTTTGLTHNRGVRLANARFTVPSGHASEVTAGGFYSRR